MSIEVRRCLRRSRLVQGLVEDWQLEHDRAMFAQDVEGMARECIDVGNLTKHTWTFLLDQLADGNSLHFADTSETMERAVVRTLPAFQTVQELITEAQRKGFTIEGAAEFEIAFNETMQIKKQIAKCQATVDWAMVKEAEQAYQRGEYQTVEELIHDAQRVGS